MNTTRMYDTVYKNISWTFETVSNELMLVTRYDSNSLVVSKSVWRRVT
jgi:hypothetical protein